LTANKFENVLECIKILGSHIGETVKEIMAIESPFKLEAEYLRAKLANPKAQSYTVLFRKGKILEEANIVTQKIGRISIESMFKMQYLISTFNEITNNFKKFSDQIDLQSADFFQNVNLWHRFFGGKEK
jgi:hypothetical protein